MKDFLYDGTFDGLLTAIFYTYKEPSSFCLFKKETYLPNLISEVMDIETEQDKADRVYNSILNKLSTHTLSNIYHLYLSSQNDIENLILEYVKLCFKYSDSINLAKNNDIIRKVDKYARQVSLEAHRFLGFVRFKEIGPHVFLAQIEPDHNILPLLTKHFTSRFNNQYFIIQDLKRKYALIYDQKEAYFKNFSKEDAKKLLSTTKEDYFESLFQSYYKNTTIAERKNERQRASYMPRRYWKHLFEVTP